MSGTGDQWYYEFDFNNNEYFVSAAYDPSTVGSTASPTGFAFGYGTIAKSTTGGVQFTPVGSATGSVDAVHGLIYIRAPWTDFGKPTPVKGSALSNSGAATYEEVGTNNTAALLESGDSASTTTAYKIGTVCSTK